MWTRHISSSTLRNISKTLRRSGPSTPQYLSCTVSLISISSMLWHYILIKIILLYSKALSHISLGKIHRIDVSYYPMSPPVMLSPCCRVNQCLKTKENSFDQNVMPYLGSYSYLSQPLYFAPILA